VRVSSFVCVCVCVYSRKGKTDALDFLPADPGLYMTGRAMTPEYQCVIQDLQI